MVVDQNIELNQEERTNQDIYDNLKFKNPFSLHGINTNNSAL